MVRSTDAARSGLVLAVTLLAMALLGSGSVVVAQDERAAAAAGMSLPDGLTLTELATGGPAPGPDGPALMRLERLTVSEAPAGVPLREARGLELLYIVEGPVAIADDFGLEGQYEAEAALFLQPPTAYGLRTEGSDQASLLRLSLVDVESDAETTPGIRSDILVEHELADPTSAPVGLSLSRAAWAPGVDAGRRVFTSPLALLVEAGTLSLTGPSGIEGQLAAGETFVVPADVPVRLRNAGDQALALLMAQLVPPGTAVLGSVAQDGESSANS